MVGGFVGRAAGVAGWMLLVAAAASAEPLLVHVDVFTSGNEGYHTFRIPAIETAPDGSLIALAEARKHNSADPGFENNDVDLVCKRSLDGGKTWSPLVVVDDPGERWSACNPATLVDQSTGRVWLLNCRTRPGRSSLTSRAGTDDAQAWVRYSDDRGATWSMPRDITAVARDVRQWGASFFGPGGGVQDPNGRLIVGLAKTTGQRNEKGQLVAGPWNAFVIYSDDHGKTWQRGGLLPNRDWGDENQLVCLADGRLRIDVRQANGPRRWAATSKDGGASWSVPRPAEPVTPVCCAIERFTRKSAGDDRNRILWTGPKGPGRQQLVVRVSYDEGQTFVGERTISPEKAAYSDLTLVGDKTAGVLWERGGYRFITFSRFNLEFLEGAASPGGGEN